MHPDHHHGAAAPGLAAPERAVLHPHAAAGLAPLGAIATPPACLGTPQKGGYPELTFGGAPRKQGKADRLDSADTASECKPLATLRARLALAGWILTATPNNQHGAFTVSRWGMVRDLGTLAAVAAFTERVAP